MNPVTSPWFLMQGIEDNVMMRFFFILMIYCLLQTALIPLWYWWVEKKEKKKMSICSAHIEPQEGCPACQTDLSKDPDFIAAHWEAVLCGSRTCKVCHFVHYKTVDYCPLCSTTTKVTWFISFRRKIAFAVRVMAVNVLPKVFVVVHSVRAVVTGWKEKRKKSS